MFEARRVWEVFLQWIEIEETYGSRLDIFVALIAKAFIIGYGLVFLFPLYYFFIGTTMTTEQMLRFPPRLVPGGHALENFRYILMETTYIHNFASSVIYAGGITLGVLVLCAPAGYALAKFDFKGNRLFMLVILVFIAVPFQVLSIPLFALLVDVGLHDTYLGAILPAMVAPFGILFIKQNLEQVIEDDLLRSARVDGASELRIFLEIVVPMAKPGIFALGVFLFIQRMKSYYWPLIVLTSDSKQVVQVWITNNSGGGLEPIQFQIVLPAALLVTLPLLILFLMANKQFIQGLTGASKG